MTSTVPIFGQKVLNNLIAKRYMIFHSDDCLLHSPSSEFSGSSMRAYPEKKDRVQNIVKTLDLNGIKTTQPKNFEIKWIEKIHNIDYIQFIQEIPENLEDIAPTAFKFSGQLHKESSWYAKLGKYFFDPATPIMGGTKGAAFAAIDCVLTMASNLYNGSNVSAALSRPPGHHAMKDCGGGYCIFNNVAVAAQYLSEKGKSVSIFDLDYHHGNGTQSLFYQRDDVQYVSIHADTKINYPFYWGFTEQKGEGEGIGFNHNINVENSINKENYLDIVDDGIKLVVDYNPDIVLISMGFDCYINDPIAGLSLNTESYRLIGEKLQNFERIGIVLEGGYDVDAIGECFTNLYQPLID